MGLGTGHRVGHDMAVMYNTASRLGRANAPATDNDLSAENVISTNPIGSRVAWICRR